MCWTVKGRVARLEIKCTERYPGFESLPLRQPEILAPQDFQDAAAELDSRSLDELVAGQVAKKSPRQNPSRGDLRVVKLLPLLPLITGCQNHEIGLGIALGLSSFVVACAGWELGRARGYRQGVRRGIEAFERRQREDLPDA